MKLTTLGTTQMNLLKNSLTIAACALIPFSAFAEGDTASLLADPETTLDCLIEPSQLVEIGSSVPGLVEQLHFERNNFVNEGEIVAQLDSRVELASLELATARAEIDTSLNLRRENAAFGMRTQKRNQQLFNESTISAQDMDKVKTETYIAQLQARQEEDNKRIAVLEAERARQALERRTIRSPISGVIVERYKAVGEYIEAEPVYRIANLDPLHVELILPVEQLGTIDLGMKAEISLDIPSQEGVKHVAVVKSVDRVADAASGTFGVLLSMPNSGLRIPSGVRCNLSMLEE